MTYARQLSKFLGTGNSLLYRTPIISIMVSVIMQETAQYGVGKVTGKYQITKEDLELVKKMERHFMKRTGCVKVEEP